MMPLISLLIAPVLASCPAVTPPGSCPKVFQVATASDGSESVDILFLSDGFEENDLPTYRCAVQRIVDSVLTEMPFAEYSCRFNFYRMDLADPAGAGGIPTPATCAETCNESSVLTAGWECDTIDAVPTNLTDTLDDCAEASLSTELCHQGQHCRFLWPDVSGQSEVISFAACLPRIPDAVVIVANTGTFGGAGFDGGDVPLAVISLSDMVEQGTWRLLAHELGHSIFGLLDEYEDEVGNVAYHSGRNIATEQEKDDADYRWREKCPGDSCDVVCWEALGTASDDAVALFEGGFYRTCGAYRSMKSCRMRSTFSESCSACNLVAGDMMAQRGITSCSE